MEISRIAVSSERNILSSEKTLNVFFSFSIIPAVRNRLKITLNFSIYRYFPPDINVDSTGTYFCGKLMMSQSGFLLKKSKNYVKLHSFLNQLIIIKPK